MSIQTVPDVREFCLRKLDQEFAALRKLAMDPKFTDPEAGVKIAQALAERMIALARFNEVANAAAKAASNAKPSTNCSIVESILAQN